MRIVCHVRGRRIVCQHMCRGGVLLRPSPVQRTPARGVPTMQRINLSEIPREGKPLPYNATNKPPSVVRPSPLTRPPSNSTATIGLIVAVFSLLDPIYEESGGKINFHTHDCYII